jgi:hypothetical protein
MESTKQFLTNLEIDILLPSTASTGHKGALENDHESISMVPRTDIILLSR